MNIVYDRGKFYNDHVRYRQNETPMSETVIKVHQQITQGISGKVFDRIGENNVRWFISSELPIQ